MKTIKVLFRLFVILKKLIPVLLLTVIFGLLGFLSAQAITVLASVAIIKFVGIEIVLSYQTIFILMVFCGVIRGFLRYLEHYTGHYAAFKMLAILRDMIFQKLRKLAPAKLEGKEKGNLISMITSDVETLEVFYAHTIAPILIYILHSIIMFFFFYFIASIYLGFIALSAYLIIGIILPVFLGKKTKSFGERYRTRYSLFASRFVDSVYGTGDLLALGKARENIEILSKDSQNIEKVNKKLKYSISTLRASSDLIVYVFDLIFLFVGLLFFQKGQYNIGQLILAFVALLGSYGPSAALGSLPGSLTHTIASGKRVLAILDEEPLVLEKTDGLDIDYNDLEIKNLSFSYEEEEVLKDLSFKFEKNKIYGIYGDSGSGKSTLLKLLMRFWDAESGDILYNGEDIKNINTASLRNNISYMTQDTYIFDLSINEIIKLGSSYTNEEIEDATRQAALTDFINGLEAQGDTKAGELGSRLSGGERQRIGLARVFLHGGSLILLDEPTSNVDAFSEALILKCAQKFKKGKTVIMVSHRESSLAICDEILHMKNGKLIKE